MNNVESASAAGDNYNLRKILLADGVGAIVGSMLGSPFPPAVYIGHPGWKAVGGRIGYSLATGVAIALVCFLGLTALLLARDPAGRDPADPALHRPGHRRAGVPGSAREATRRRSCWRSFRTSPSGRRRRSTARSMPPAPPPPQVGLAKLAGTGVRVPRHGVARRRLGAGRHGARRDRGVHHRQQAAARGGRGRSPARCSLTSG